MRLELTVRGLDEMIAYVESWAAPISAHTEGLLHDALEDTFRDTQERTHVITDSLRQSGKVYVERPDPWTWVGVIEYGGESTGPKNPVTYAIYEKNRGGDHDFFATIPQHYPQFAEAMQEMQ